jgi:hypothetical protein
MSCLSQIVFIMLPRIVLVLVFLNTTYVQRAANHGLLLPLVGFVFLPLTVLAYALMVDVGQSDTSIGFLLLIISMATDLGSLFVGASHRRRG